MKDDGRTDAALLAATTAGDGAAFTVLVRRYIRSGTLLAAQLLGDSDEAEDVVQEAFTIVHHKARAFDAQRTFAPWFFAIVRRLAANRRARDARRDRLLRLWRREAEGELTGPEPEGAVFARLDSGVVQRAVAGLSPMQRSCFELVVIRDLSTEEVAAMHGISESTVRQHVFRARTALRSVLNEEGLERSRLVTRRSTP